MFFILMLENVIGLIFRVPQKGKVKTRLAKEIGEEQAFYYYSLMLDETVSLCRKIEKADLVGFYQGFLEQMKFDFPLIKQRGENLGEIIFNAIRELEKRGYNKKIIIGSDSPDIPKHFFYDAIRSLDEYEYVIGPTEDGGFYMFGCVNCSEALFSEIIWGSPHVFENLLKNIINIRKSYCIMPGWYDIDDKNSLERWLFYKR